jgi:hypothetical protein
MHRQVTFNCISSTHNKNKRRSYNLDNYLKFMATIRLRLIYMYVHSREIYIPEICWICPLTIRIPVTTEIELDNAATYATL